MRKKWWTIASFSLKRVSFLVFLSPPFTYSLSLSLSLTLDSLSNHTNTHLLYVHRSLSFFFSLTHTHTISSSSSLRLKLIVWKVKKIKKFIFLLKFDKETVWCQCLCCFPSKWVRIIPYSVHPIYRVVSINGFLKRI